MGTVLSKIAFENGRRVGAFCAHHACIVSAGKLNDAQDIRPHPELRPRVCDT